MATKTDKNSIHGEEEVEPRFGGDWTPGQDSPRGYDRESGDTAPPPGHRPTDGDSDFDNIVNSNYSNAEQSAYSSAARRGDPGFKSPTAGESRQAIGAQESAGANGSSTAVGAGEQSLMDRVGAAEARGKAQRMRIRQEKAGRFDKMLGGFGNFKQLTKKKVATAAVTSTLIGGGIFGINILQAPGMLVQLSQSLSKSSRGTEDTAKIRMHATFRYYKSGDIGETRVGIIGSKLVGKAMEDLKKIGIEFDLDPQSGHPRAMTVDTSKHPEFKGMSRAAASAAIADKYKVPVDKVARIGTGSDVKGDKLAINMRDFNMRTSTMFVNTSMSGLDSGKTATGLMSRSMKKFFNLPSLYSPIKKAVANKQNRHATKKERKERERARKGERKGAVSAKAADAKKKLNEKLDGKKAKLGAGLVATEAVCLVRDVADLVPITNRAEIVAPAVIESVDKEAVGDQVQSGINIDQSNAAGVAESFEDENGKTIFSAKALQALQGDERPDGEDLHDDYKQAFSNDTTAAKIKGIVDFPFADQACSTPGQIAQGALGIGLLLLGPGGWAVNVGKGAAGTASSIAILHLLQDKFAKLLSNGEITPETFAGAQGGNLLAYGAREAANITARSSGGVPLSDSESAFLDQRHRQEDREEFQSKSFAGRVFDVNDHRSLVAGLVTQTSTNPATNAKRLVGSVTNFGAVASNIFSSLTPKANAAVDPYNWDFPAFGIPQEILNDDAFADPIENAKQAATVLSSPEGNNYIERAKKCFGVSISKGANGWQAVAEEDVNPNDEDYGSGNCGDLGDANWKRILLFVFDDRLIAAAACFEGDESICGEMGAGNENVSPADETTAGDANLKKTILIDSPGKFITMPKKYSCEGRTTRLDSRIAASLAYLLTKYDMCADDGLANGHKSHGAGLGVDMRPKNNNDSKEEWKKTVEAAARDMGWTGDSATDGKSSKGCASYSGYGQCVGGQGDIPKWVRWIGYNGDVDHGDPWHIFGGSYAHIHIGWNTPNNDGVSPSIISKPVPEVYTFPAPVPDDLKELIK